MEQVITLDIEDEVWRRLCDRAARHGWSVEGEIRDILRGAVADDAVPSPGLGTQVANLFRGLGLDTPIPELRGTPARLAHFDE